MREGEGKLKGAKASGSCKGAANPDGTVTWDRSGDYTMAKKVCSGVIHSAGRYGPRVLLRRFELCPNWRCSSGPVVISSHGGIRPEKTACRK
jgi:hypothetical protein